MPNYMLITRNVIVNIYLNANIGPPSVPEAKEEEVICMINYLYLTSIGNVRGTSNSVLKFVSMCLQAFSRLYSLVRHRSKCNYVVIFYCLSEKETEKVRFNPVSTFSTMITAWKF